MNGAGPEIPNTPAISRNGPMRVKAMEIFVRGKPRQRTSIVCFDDRGNWVGAVQVVASPAGRRATVRILGAVEVVA